MAKEKRSVHVTSIEWSRIGARAVAEGISRGEVLLASFRMREALRGRIEQELQENPARLRSAILHLITEAQGNEDEARRVLGATVEEWARAIATLELRFSIDMLFGKKEPSS